MPSLGPGIHVFARSQGVDGRDKPGRGEINLIGKCSSGLAARPNVRSEGVVPLNSQNTHSAVTSQIMSAIVATANLLSGWDHLPEVRLRLFFFMLAPEY
jgi:hypothetical protein